MIRVRIPRLLDETNVKNPEMTTVEGTKKQIFGQKDCTTECVMALTLNQEKKTERIIIGERYQVEFWLARCGGGEFYYDAERPLGTLLLEHRTQKSEDWNQYAGGLLQQALRDAQSGRTLEEEAWDYLEPMLYEPDPITKFTAYQCWSWYHKYKALQDNTNTSQAYGDDFLGLNLIYDSVLNVFFDDHIWEYDYDIKHAWERVRCDLNQIGRLSDFRLDVRYSEQNRGGEWLVITDSFYPMLQYYLKKLMEWKLCVCQCSICSKMFLAPSRHYSLCGKACHAEQNRQNKRQFDARAKKNGYDIDYKNTSQRMRNRLNKLRKQTGTSQEKYAAAKKQFEVFRKDAVAKKKQIHDDKDRREFQNWLFEQERKFEKVCAN